MNRDGGWSSAPLLTMPLLTSALRIPNLTPSGPPSLRAPTLTHLLLQAPKPCFISEHLHLLTLSTNPYF